MALLDGGTSSSSLVQVGPTPNGQPPRRAIALRLSEETLAQLMALASRGNQPNKGTLQIDLGSNPTFMFNGASYPVTLLEEAPHTELLCYTRAKSGSATTSDSTLTPRRLQRFADVSHKATLKPSSNLDRVSQALREQRSVAEKEKQGKRAVLIESAPPSRSNSKNRHPTANASTSAVPMPLLPVASTSVSSSTTTSPAIRPSSRLIAAAQKATPAQVAAAAAAKRSPPEHKYVSPAAVSPPSTALATTHPSPPHAVSPARQHSSTSSESSITSSSSLLQHSTTSTATSTGTGASGVQKGRTSLSSVESPAAVASELPVASIASSSPTKPIAAGGGGVLKGKDSIKKEKQKRQRRKDEVAEAVRIASKPRHDQHEPLAFSPLLMRNREEDEDEDEDEDAEGEVDEEMTFVAQEEEPRSLLKKKRRVTIAGGEVGSDASATKSSRSRVATPTPLSSTASTAKKRKRALAKSERWYSSSSESEGEASLAASMSKAGAGKITSNRSKGLSVPPATKNGSLVKRRRTVSSNDLLALPTAGDSDPERGRPNSDAASLSRASSSSNQKAQPVRSSSLSQVVATSTSTSTPLDPSDASPSLTGTTDASDRYVTITSSASFERHRQLFEEAYPSYRALYDTLMQERQILASKEGGRTSQGRYTLDEVRKLVKRLEMNRDELERIKLGLKKYAMTAGIPLVLNGGTAR